MHGGTVVVRWSRLPRSLLAALLALAALLPLAACSDDDGPASPPDADAGPPDTGAPPDAGPSACERVDCAAGATCSELDGRCHCGSAEGPVCAAGEACDGAACVPALPAPRCTPGTRWAPGTLAFRDATDDWGLGALQAEGVRLAIADIDGDGWADLFVRRVGTGSDDFAPEGTRQSWLLRNTGGHGFEDVTEPSGIRARRVPEGTLGRPGEVAAFGDVDGDGDLDVYTGLSTADLAASMSETSELLLNDGHGLFALAPAESELRRATDVDVPAGASFLDFDRDGALDLWVAQHNYGTATLELLQNHLYRGDGTGSFAEVTIDAGLRTFDWVSTDTINGGRGHARSWSAAACDLDGDGTPELLAASYGRAPNHLWQAHRADDGTVTYENRSVASGYAYDDDLTWQDNQFALCYCQANRTAEGCDGLPRPSLRCDTPAWTHDTDREPFRLGGNSGTTVCADLDNDGDLDLLTTEIQHWWAGEGADHSEILENTGEAAIRFTRPGREATGLEVPHTTSGGWDEGHMTAAVFDFDNDGWPDVYVGGSDYAGNHGLLYHHAEGALSFAPVPIEDGIDHHRSQGVVVADLDRDGDLDVVVGHSRARCDATQPDDCYETAGVHVFENLAEPGNWLQLELAGGEGSNRAAIGARVTVTAGGVTQTREVGGGYGHYGSQDDLVVHVGLGAACEAEVAVRWPDAALTTERFVLPAGYRFRVEQGAAPRVVPVPER